MTSLRSFGRCDECDGSKRVAFCWRGLVSDTSGTGQVFAPFLSKMVAWACGKDAKICAVEFGDEFH